MKNILKTALEPFGQALLAYWRGDKAARLIHDFKSGGTATIPVSEFFRSPEAFYPTEKVLPWCRGRILVVGAGSGVHAVTLQASGHEVTAVEVSPQTIEILSERGITDIRQCDFFEMPEEAFDTILMLGHTIGICETVSRIPVLLSTCASLLAPGGQLLANSVDEALNQGSTDSPGYPGELEFRISFKGRTGPWMRWLHVDFDTLSEKASDCGWNTERLEKTKNGEFLARLTPI